MSVYTYTYFVIYAGCTVSFSNSVSKGRWYLVLWCTFVSAQVLDH